MLLFICSIGQVWADSWTWTAATGDDVLFGTVYTASGRTVLNGKSWSFSRANAGNTLQINTSCLQFGKSSNPETVVLSTRAFNGTITQIDVECSSASAKHTCKIEVGETTVKAATDTESWTKTGTISTSTISVSGEVKISFTPTSGAGALYLKSISVTYTPATYNVDWYVGDTKVKSETSVATGTPPSVANNALGGSCSTLTFLGWTETEISGIDDAPTDMFTSYDVPGLIKNTTYHAVFGEIDYDTNDTTLIQMHQYDTWTFGGSTTDKTSYRAFHNTGYVQSAPFDLSGLAEVYVQGGTLGGDSYNSLTIGDGTNTWKDVTVTGDKATGKNFYINGTSLSGRGVLKVTSNSGSATSSGVRMTRVGIFTFVPQYSNCRTTCISEYSITLDKNSASADASGSAKVLANATTLRDLSAPTRTGCVVEGYYTNAACTTKVATAAGELQPSITVGGNAWTDEDGEWVRGADETFYTKWLTYSDYKFSCAELTLEAKLVTASTPIFITSAAGKTVRSQDSILITGSGLTPNQALEFPNLDSKFTVKSRTNTALTVEADGTINAVAYIFYTPGADETTDGILKATGLTVKVGGGKPRQATLTQDIIGRHIATDFVIAGKKDGKWYAMPDTMTTTSHPTPIEIAVDDYDNPSIAYTASTNMYNLYGQNSGAGYLEEAGQYVKLGMKNNPNFANYPLLGTSSTSLGKSTGTDPTNNLDKQYWWLFTQTNKNITNPQDAKYIVHCANNASSLSIKNSPSQWGLYASGVDEIRLIPASSVENTESEVVAWGQKKLILEIEKPLLATQARAKISGGSWSANKSLATTTGTSVKGSATKYNYTLDFTSDDFDFANAANEGKMLIVELLNSEGTALKASSVIIPRIVAADRTINKTTDDKKTPWNTEVHVLPGVTLTLDASGYSTPKNMTIKELNVYPGATINVEKDTLKATTLILRNGWNRLGASTEYDVARIYITKDAGSLQATNVYADWYIDFDQYYPIAVPWNVTVENIKYKNTKAAATFGESSSIRLRYYDGASRAANVQSGVGESANWKIFGAGTNDAVPETLEPGKGYAMCAKRPTGKAFSIVRMPLTLPSGTWDAGSWTKNGESGSVSTDHKDQVSVTAHGDEKTPTYAKGWNFIANPYMAIYQGAISHSVGEEYNVEFVNIPDTEFKEYEQKSVELAKLKPASAFLIQATATGTLTFGTTHRQASAPSYRNDTRPAVSRQKAHIVLSGEGAEDVMGIFVSEKYTAEYELNADLQKLLSDGNTLRTYMRYGDMNMAYVAINEELAREWIPVMVRMPENGEYTFSLHLASTVSELEGLYLTDYQTGITTNLLFDDYSFTAAAGTLSNRFAINAIVGDHRVPTGADVTGLDKDSKEPIKFIWHDNVYILHNNVIYDSTGKRVNVINK